MECHRLARSVCFTHIVTATTAMLFVTSYFVFGSLDTDSTGYSLLRLFYTPQSLYSHVYLHTKYNTKFNGKVDTQLNEWPMIMAHDAATTYLPSTTEVNRFAKTQSDGGFASMLNCGVRAFDLRPGPIVKFNELIQCVNYVF